MKPLLAIFNPRHIHECIASLERLRINKVWLTGYTERELEGVVPRVVNEAEKRGYTHMVAESDDGLVPPPALDAVLAGLAEGHPVVTGYSNLDQTDWRVNLTKTPFVEADYDLYHISEVLAHPDPWVPTYFAAYALTGMSLEMWQRYPFKTMGEGWASDRCLSERLTADDVPIVAAREGFTYHVKELVNHFDTEPRKRLLVGEVEAQVRWDEATDRKSKFGGCSGYGLEGPPCLDCPQDERCASVAAFWDAHPQHDPRCDGTRRRTNR